MYFIYLILTICLVLNPFFIYLCSASLNHPQCSNCGGSRLLDASCTVEKDCAPNNAVGIISGTPPNCVCDCKPGWQGNKCDSLQIILNTSSDGYMLEGYVTCKFADSYEAAVTRCQSYGDGWDIATVPGSHTNDLYKVGDQWPNSFWLGGHDIVQHGKWVWQAGRMKGKAFWDNGPVPNMFHAWNGNNPDYWKCGNSTQNYLTRQGYTNGWDDSFDKRDPDIKCPKLSSCAACERSPCEVSLDCNNRNNTFAKGYYPNCTCLCMAGWVGSDCDINVGIKNVTHKNYVSQFIIACANMSSYTFARQVCRWYGDGWDVATVGSPAANNAIKSIATNVSWIGGLDRLDSGKWSWNSGRMNNMNFWSSSSGTASSNGTCDTGMYCNWGPSQPDIAKCGNLSKSSLVIQPSGEWKSSNQVANIQCKYLPSCVICERLPCIHSIDCNVNGSFQVAGYYPFCVCKCLPGWKGDKCKFKYDLPSVDVNDSKSEFYVGCDPTANTFATAAEICKAFKQGWDIASVPNAKANDAIARAGANIPDSYRIPFISIWIGGSDDGHEGDWKWVSGRLKDKTFTPTNAPAGGNATCMPGMYCNWAKEAPNNYICKHQSIGENAAVMYKRDKNNWTWNDTTTKKICYDVPSCVACERSPCILRDANCDGNNTANATGYFPDCKCLCKPGYGGNDCSIRICDTQVDCNDNAISVNGTFPSCVCHCKPEWGGSKCDTRVCDVITDCNNHSSSVVGLYPNCRCSCVGKWTGPSCDSRPCDIATDCNPVNTKEVIGSFPSCYCQCKQGWGDKMCNTRFCDVVADCNNRAISVDGDYPECVCNCLPHYALPNCSFATRSFTKSLTLVSTTTETTTTLSPGLLDCPFSGLYPCLDAPSTPNIKKAGILWPMQLEAGSLLSKGSATIVLSVLRNKTFNITAKNALLLTKSSAEGGSDVPYDQSHNAAFVLDEITTLTDRMLLKFKETTPGSTKAGVPTKMILRFISSYLVDKCCNGVPVLLKNGIKSTVGGVSSDENALDVGEITIESIPSAPVSGRAINFEAKAAINSLMYPKNWSCEKSFMGATWVELTAAAPLGRLLPIDISYYARAILANVILLALVTVVHLIIVIVVSKVSEVKKTLEEHCADWRFPSVSIGCLFALSPCNAIATGGLLGAWSGAGDSGCYIYPIGANALVQVGAILGVLMVIGTCGFSVLYPLFWLKRGHFPLKLASGKTLSAVWQYFPATIILPLPHCEMFHSLVGTIQLESPIWPSVPLWSSVVLFIFSLIQSFAATKGVMQIISTVFHIAIIAVVLVFRPFYALSLNFLYCIALVPIMILTFIQGIVAITNSEPGGNIGIIMFCCLVTFVVMTRLLTYIVQPLRCFILTYPSEAISESPIWKKFDGDLVNGVLPPREHEQSKIQKEVDWGALEELFNYGNDKESIK